MWADTDFTVDPDEDMWVVCSAPVPRVIVDPPCPVKIKVKEVRVKAPAAPIHHHHQDNGMTKDENKQSPTHRHRHPPMASMIREAIVSLHERGGSSLQAIKKFISDTYTLDTDKLGRFIRKYLRDAVNNGILLHPKGKGATGHFKLTKKGKMAMGHSAVGTEKHRSTKLKRKMISGGRPKVKKPKVKVANMKPVRMYASDVPIPGVPTAA